MGHGVRISPLASFVAVPDDARHGAAMDVMNQSTDDRPMDRRHGRRGRGG
jgi:hypothetical protein